MITVLPAASGAAIFAAVNISGWLYATIRAHHAERLAQRHVDGAVAHRNRLALHLAGKAGEVLELCARGVHVARHLGNGIAAIRRVEQRELVGVLAQSLRRSHAVRRRARAGACRAMPANAWCAARAAASTSARIGHARSRRGCRPVAGIERRRIATVRALPLAAVVEIAMTRQCVVRRLRAAVRRRRSIDLLPARASCTPPPVFAS